jgi:hypothetical protein
MITRHVINVKRYHLAASQKIVLQISSTRLRFGKHLVEDTPKSRAGRRTLPIPDQLAATWWSTKQAPRSVRTR